MVNYAVQQFELLDVYVCVCGGEGGMHAHMLGMGQAFSDCAYKYSNHFSLKCLTVFSKQLRTCACLQNHIKI